MVWAAEIGINDVQSWITLVVGLSAILGLLYGLFRVVYWIRTQMAENGLTKKAGTEGYTFRDLQERQIVTGQEIISRIDDMANDMHSMRQGLDVVSADRARLEVNQREQGQNLRETIRKFDDHLVIAADVIRKLDEHIADHTHEPKDEP